MADGDMKIHLEHGPLDGFTLEATAPAPVRMVVPACLFFPGELDDAPPVLVVYEPDQVEESAIALTA